MNILITGSAGFVGRHFVKKLTPGNTLYMVDIASGHDCRDFFKQCDTVFDLVIHLAAIVGGRKNIDYNPIGVATDLSIDAEMFNWAVRTKQKKIVYFSSSAAYPIVYQEKIYSPDLSESLISFKDSIKLPDMTYGWAKITGEYLASFAQEAGVDVIIFRPFSGYGPDQALDYPFPSFIQRAVQRKDPFEIWGNGQQIRDFIHIDDIVNATMKAVKSGIIGTYNLGTGRATSFIDLANLVCEEVGYKPQYAFYLENPVGVLRRVANTRQMKSFYIPKITLEEGIAEAVQYYETTYKI